MYGGGDVERQAAVARARGSCSHLLHRYLRQTQVPAARRGVRCRAELPRAMFRPRSATAAFGQRSAARSICLIRHHSEIGAELDARQSPTLARPAAPLAACVQRISSTSHPTLTPPAECHRNSVLWIEQTKIGCHGNVPSGIEKSNFVLIIYSCSSTKP